MLAIILKLLYQGGIRITIILKYITLDIRTSSTRKDNKTIGLLIMQHWVEGTRATISRTYKLRNKNAIGGLSRWQWNHMGDHNYNLKYSLWSWEEIMIFYELLWPNNVQINETVLFLKRIEYQKDLKPFCINLSIAWVFWTIQCL